MVSGIFFFFPKAKGKLWAGDLICQVLQEFFNEHDNEDNGGQCQFTRWQNKDSDPGILTWGAVFFFSLCMLCRPNLQLCMQYSNMHFCFLEARLKCIFGL